MIKFKETLYKMTLLPIDFEKTALILIDLQKGIVQVPGGDLVVAKAKKLVDLFRRKDGFISFVRVSFHDGKEVLSPLTDNVQQPVFGRTDGWDELVQDFGAVPGKDYIVTKRQWGAFFGTDLDLQLRRRNIDTIVLCGIATNIGVETTAREAFQHGYNQVFITDAMTAMSQQEHDATVRYIFPRIGKVRTTDEFLEQVQ
jgi:nicotinamidase-related amidase